MLGHFGRGEMFGEQSALNDLPNPFTMVAATKKVEYYKIHRSHFTQFYDGMNADGLPGGGACVSQMRANIILKNNWFCSKLMQMEMMDCSDLWKLEYCNDADLNSAGQPTKTAIKEVPFIRNNQRAAAFDANAGNASNENDSTMSESKDHSTGNNSDKDGPEKEKS